MTVLLPEAHDPKRFAVPASDEERAAQGLRWAAVLRRHGGTLPPALAEFFEDWCIAAGVRAEFAPQADADAETFAQYVEGQWLAL